MGRRRFAPTVQDRERADALRVERESRGLTQAELAARIGVSTRTLRRMESGTGPISMTHWDRTKAVFAESAPRLSAPPPPSAASAERLSIDEIPAPSGFPDLTLQEWLLVTSFRELPRERRALLVSELLASRWMHVEGGIEARPESAGEDVPPVPIDRAIEEASDLLRRLEERLEQRPRNDARKSSGS